MKIIRSATKVFFFVALFGFFTLLPYQAAQAVIQKMSLSDTNSCAVHNNGKVYCWGSNGDGQTGNNNPPNSVLGPYANSARPIYVAGSVSRPLDNVIQVAVSKGGYTEVLINRSSPCDFTNQNSSHTCALTNEGGQNYIYCWGRSVHGSLGEGSTNMSSSYARRVDQSGMGTSIKEIATGGDFTCAVTTAGDVWCWGSNEYGQLGNGTTTHSARPVRVKITDGPPVQYRGSIQSITAGRYHACGLITTGAVVCWGKNNFGQLGNRNTANVYYAGLDALVYNSYDASAWPLLNISSIDAGGYSTCAIDFGNTAWCWGANHKGQLGIANNVPSTSNIALQVANSFSGTTYLPNVRQISAGGGVHRQSNTDGALCGTESISDQHTCAVDSSNRAFCWGYDYYRQLGNHWPSTVEPGKVYQDYWSRPLQLDASATTNFPSNVSQVFAGEEYSCLVNVNGEVYCWGRNLYSVLGTGSSNPFYIPFPQKITINNFNLFSECGDGTRAAPVEECDDGDLDSNDGCDSACQLEDGFSCTTAVPNICTTVCGDGIIRGTEQCDILNRTTNTALCDMATTAGTQRCTDAVCGDGYTNSARSETCDSNGLQSSTCDYYVYPVTSIMHASSCTSAACGDGYVNTTLGETCDDGNTTPNDGCDAACHRQAGYTCTTVDAVTINDCNHPICGDGLRVGTELTTPNYCDDGNTRNDDGCSSTCTIELGFSCGGIPYTCTPICADGRTVGIEATTPNFCEHSAVCPGNTACGTNSISCDLNADANAQRCTFRACNDGYINRSLRADGITPIEDCEEFTGMATPINTATCDWNGGTGDQSCTTRMCGDGYINTVRGTGVIPAETCDYTNMRNPDGTGQDRADCDWDTGIGSQSCTARLCGDGYINATAGTGGIPPETCDFAGMTGDRADCDWNGGIGSQSCTAPLCGDGYHNAVAGEACDTGAINTRDCDSDANSAALGQRCTLAMCGDGYINGARNETCDFVGMTSDRADCDWAGGSDTTNTCTAATCGDSYRNAVAGEACDNGNTNSLTCDSAPDANSGSLTQRCTLPVCGDGYENNSLRADGTELEMCDDRNTVTEECPYGLEQCPICNATCRTIDGETDFCDDGVIDTYAGETCDEGRALNGQPLHCNATCTGQTIAGCGNGVPETGEDCDDGNTAIGHCAYGATSCSECNTTCSGRVPGITSYCGDRTLDGANEACEDGNTANGDGCDSDCEVESGFGCTLNTTTNLSVCFFHCGNGRTEDGVIAPGETGPESNFGENCDYGIPDKVPAALGPGGLYNGQRCSNTQYGGTCNWCSADCRQQTSSGRFCRDGTVDVDRPGTPELCDDGNNTDSDGCTNGCLISEGYTCTGTHSVCTTRCGDGRKALGTENCTNCPEDFGACTIARPKISTQHESGLFGSLFERIKSVIVKPEPRVTIPGLNFTEPKTTIQLPTTGDAKTYEPDVRTPIQIGNEYHHITVQLGTNDSIRFTLESCPNYGVLVPGKAQEVDTDCDGTPNALIEFKGVKNGKLEISTTLLKTRESANAQTPTSPDIDTVYEYLITIIQIFSRIMYI